MSANPPAGSQSISELKARIEAERGDQPFLLYRDGDDRQQLFTFAPGLAQASVGRERSSDLVLGWDGQVSRLHARFERAGEGWTVVDDGLSSNGTFVNGERLSGRHRLSDGDSLRFAATIVTFRQPRGEEGAGAVGGQTPAPEDLSSAQLRVLGALCGLYRDGKGLDSPAADQQIAEDLFLSVGVVTTHLSVLFAKFGLDGLPQNERPVRLVERAIYAGLISERDL